MILQFLHGSRVPLHANFFGTLLFLGREFCHGGFPVFSNRLLNRDGCVRTHTFGRTTRMFSTSIRHTARNFGAVVEKRLNGDPLFTQPTRGPAVPHGLGPLVRATQRFVGFHDKHGFVSARFGSVHTIRHLFRFGV